MNGKNERDPITAIPILKSKPLGSLPKWALQENAKPGNLFIPSHRYPSP